MGENKGRGERQVKRSGPTALVQALGWLAVVAALAGVTALDFAVLRVNSATAGFTYLLLVLTLATWIGLRESIVASVASVFAYNFFFLPPVLNFTIADPQNWVALVAFLTTAVIVSQLSSRARERTKEAQERQKELEGMYSFSRGLLLGRDDCGFAAGVIRQVVDSFSVSDVWLYERSTRTISKMIASENAFDEGVLERVAERGEPWINESAKASVVPIRLGGTSLGSLAIRGQRAPSEVALDAVAQLVAIAIERARVREASARIEITRQNEQLKATLLDALAHEFKTPLTSVKAATTTLLSSSLNPADQRQLVVIVDEEADRMTRLVTDSIDLARIGTAPIVLARTAASPTELLTSALKDLRGLFDGRELVLEMEDSLPTVFVDKGLSELAVRQVINNALKYSPGDSSIEIRAMRKDDSVVIHISDYGAGISKVDQARIFEKFYRGQDVRNRVAGTGLGLSIAREIIESQGGRISLKTEEGRGSTFSLTMPVQKPEELP